MIVCRSSGAAIELDHVSLHADICCMMESFSLRGKWRVRNVGVAVVGVGGCSDVCGRLGSVQ